jgi:hypothetical protein
MAERDKYETSATAFFREAIEAGKADEVFGDAALEGLAAALITTADEIGDESDPAALLLMHASAAITFLCAQVLQDQEVIEGLAVDLDAARKERGSGDGKG